MYNIWYTTVNKLWFNFYIIIVHNGLQGLTSIRADCIDRQHIRFYGGISFERIEK